MNEPIYASSSLHPAYLRGKHAVLQEAISFASYMLENAITNFKANQSSDNITIMDGPDYLFDDEYISDTDVDED